MKRYLAGLLHKLGYDNQREERAPLWPVPMDVNVITTPFLLLLTPPNSGSTAIAKWLGQMESIAPLQERSFEGQWLIKGLCNIDRWWPEKYVDYKSVAAIWQARIDAQRAKRDFTYILEKSPPNMVRYEELLKIIPDTRIVVNNRDPYANIASQLNRYYGGPDSELRRDEAIRYLARLWVYRSRLLQQACVDRDYPLVSYETFCYDPLEIARAFDLEVDELNHTFKVKVKDYKKQRIRNMNSEQVRLLSQDEVGIVTDVLRPERAMVEFFGYALR